MKLLVVLTHYPFPLNTGGAIVAFNVIKRLSLNHSISLICIKPEDVEVDVDRLNFVDKLELIPRKKVRRLNEWLCYLKCLLLGEPYSVGKFASRKMRKKVEYILSNEDIDAVLLFDISAIQYCPPSSFCKVLINIEDPQSIKLKRMKKLPILSIGEKVRFSIMSKYMASYEKKYLYRMSRVFLLSKADVCDVKKECSYGKVSYLPYGVEQNSPREIVNYKDRERVIVFSGNMYHPPNVDGVLFFLKDIFPAIIQKFPSVVFWIVGAKPKSDIYNAAIAFGSNIVITGKVVSVPDFVKRATVSICPVRLKIGVQTKILEALSWGTPVVTTGAGNSGVGGVSGSHLWVEDDSERFAEKVCELLAGINWEKFSQKGLQLASEQFSWEKGVLMLEQHINEMVALDL